ncbi:MAG: fibronectin type III domain-containing protein [Nitrospira sp.]|nr:MAG: fibronectin type III domain-containing protein [Nitrospira sp.]
MAASLLFLTVLSQLSFSVFAQTDAQTKTPLAPPHDVRVFDTPSDGGGSLTVLWAPAPDDSAATKYQVLVSEGTTVADPAAMNVVAEFPANQRYVRESKWPWWTRPSTGEQHQFTLKNGKGVELKNGNAYSVTVAAVSNGDRAIATPVQATPEPNWINWNQMNNLLLALLFGGIVFYAISTARKREIFLRRIPGLDAVDEAIGRATELGKPILYMTGAHDMSDPSTIAAAVILGRVAKRTAAYGTDLLVPHRDPITMAVCQEVTKQAYLEAGKPDKQAYLEAGKPDLYKDDSNFFITSDQFSYTAAVDGIMLRKKPAANFFMGHYFAEALLLTETGASTGAIQIAGTDADHQLPFFVTTCDYTLIGEELYAASAYLSREPVQVGTLRGQDIGKALILGVLGVGTILATLGVMLDAQWPKLFLDCFRDVK